MGIAMGQVADLRSQAYMLLSLVFRQPDSRLACWFGTRAATELIKDMVEGLPVAAPGEQLGMVVGRGRAIVADGEMSGLVAEYNSLFAATPKVQVPLWASAYIGGERAVGGEPARLANATYARAGFGLGTSCFEQPDHLVPELQFMSVLSRMQWSAWRREDLDEVMHCAALESEFVAEHLCPWTLDGLQRRIQEWSPTGFYQTAVSALVELLTMDRSWMPTVIHSLAGVEGGSEVPGRVS